jgi:ribonuclease HI
MFQAYFDGSFNEETRRGGIGVVLLRDGQILEKHSEEVEVSNSNVAELLACKKALLRLSHRRARHIQVFGDHVGVINGLNTDRMKYYSIKEEENAVRFLANRRKRNPLRMEAFDLLRRFDKCELIVIKKEFNALADSLAAQGSGCLGWGKRCGLKNGYLPVPCQVQGGFRYFWKLPD